MSPRGRVRIDGSTMPRQLMRAQRVRAHEPLELVDLGVGDRPTSRRDAGVVHEDVDVAEVVETADSTMASSCGLVVVDRRPAYARADAARGLDRGHRLLGGIGVLAVVHRDRRALRGEQP